VPVWHTVVVAPAATGHKAHQLNWALRPETLQALLGGDHDPTRVYVGVSDADSLPDRNTYRWLAAGEGVFCEPASAASVAGLLAHGLPTVDDAPPPESVVCVLTGHGLKDPDTALSKAPPVINCENDLAAVERAVFA